MNEDQRRELYLLADGLETLPPTRFHIGLWGIGTLDPYASDFSCAFDGCAIGWAPRFIPDCQLRLEKVANGVLQPCFRNARGIDAVALYFGIRLAEAKYLFLGGSYPYPYFQVPATVVSARIREFLRVPREGAP